ncbi:MAG TPA: heme o synthase, partial [Cytophagaceae bacterium]
MVSKEFDNVVEAPSLGIRMKAWLQLLKFRLTFVVTFSGGMGYMLGATKNIDTLHFILFILGGFLMTVSANVINQIIEKDSDRLMKRTSGRPLPTGVISVSEAMTFALVTGIVGFAILLFYTNTLAALLTLFSTIMYGFAYTPLKRINPVAVLVGAIPGALPPLIGWVAITGEFQILGFLLFGIQFIWQFPHFWAIAWVLDDDYKKAGIRLLPGNGAKDINTAFQIMIYTLMLIPLGLIPAKLGYTGIN